MLLYEIRDIETSSKVSVNQSLDTYPPVSSITTRKFAHHLSADWDLWLDLQLFIFPTVRKVVLSLSPRY